jgi:molecular chaperone GrpE
MEEDTKIQKEGTINEIEELKAKTEEYLNGWKRERADFLNYKKDEMERIGNLAKYANEELILNLLPVLDNLNLAETYLKDLPAQAGEGIFQIKKQFLDLLKKEGIEPMKTLYEKFDPNYMEVVEEVDARDASHGEDGWKVEEPGIVVEVVQEGYTLHNKIIRVAKVKISK